MPATLWLGSVRPVALMLGDRPVTAAYLGDEPVWVSGASVDLSVGLDLQPRARMVNVATLDVTTGLAVEITGSLDPYMVITAGLDLEARGQLTNAAGAEIAVGLEMTADVETGDFSDDFSNDFSI